MTTRIIPFPDMKKNHPKLPQICSYGICFKGPKNEFEAAVVNEPSVFEPLKFYCIVKMDSKRLTRTNSTTDTGFVHLTECPFTFKYDSK